MSDKWRNLESSKGFAMLTTETKFKSCRNCHQLYYARRRKCPDRQCGSIYYDEPNAAQCTAHDSEEQSARDYLAKLMGGK